MRILSVAAILLSSSIAAAQAPGQTLEYAEANDEPTSAPTQVETVSYRKQVLLADGLSVAEQVTAFLAGRIATKNESDGIKHRSAST